MSQPDNPTSQAILDSVQTAINDQRLLVAFAALPMYEYLITFGREVELVWRQKTKFSLTSILLVSTRLCMIASAIAALNSTQSTCMGIETMSVIQYFVDVIGFVQTALFSALRVSALYNRNAVLFVAILMLGLAPATTNILNAARATYIQQPGVCIGGSRIGDALARKLVLISRIPVIVADFLVLILTWAKTYQQTLRSQRLGMPTTLSTCLLRDGAVYFLALLTMNIVQIATHRTRLGAPVSIVIATFPSILISRFMLNLRQVGNLENADDTENSTVSSVRFQLSAEIIGSMGASLDHGGPIAPDSDDGKQHGEVTEAVSHVSRCGEPRTF